jgi:predicted RNA-binding protein YlxR (DUF448 family)
LPRSSETTERTCIVTRQTLPVDALVRFVVDPSGEVVADLRRRLPGRGVWVTARMAEVEAAEKRRLFPWAFGGPAKVAPGLAERVAERLRAAALSALSLARKAGGVVTGFAKVETALARDPVVALIHAAEAGEDGVAKLAAAARRRGSEGPMPVIRLYTGEQLDLACGGTNVVHAALLAGPASDNALSRVNALADYLGEAARFGSADSLPEPSEVSAGP